MISKLMASESQSISSMALLGFMPSCRLNSSDSRVVDGLVLAMCSARVDDLACRKDKHVYHLVVYTDCVFAFLSRVISVCLLVLLREGYVQLGAFIVSFSSRAV